MSNADFSKWIGDGSEASTLTVSGDIINIASATAGTPFNARLDADIPSGDLYYEVSVSDLPKGSHLAVGLVAEEKFLPGWKTKGYFYNGNISNGSAGLIIGFGSHTKTGDVIGVYLRRLDESFEVVFYHNGRCLGAGFSMKDSSTLYPCLHVSGNASVKVVSRSPPTVFTRETFANSNDIYSGTWEIKRIFVGPELGEFQLPESSRFKLSLEKVQDKQYRLLVKITNTFSTTIELGDKIDAFDSIRFLGHCMTTRMIPHPEHEELEKLVGKELNGGDHESDGLKKIMVTPDGNLLLSGPIMEMSYVRHVETFKPVVSIDY